MAILTGLCVIFVAAVPLRAQAPAEAPAPSATPAVTPGPAPETIVVKATPDENSGSDLQYQIVPPLSIDESCQKIREIITVLGGDPASVERQSEPCSRMLRAIGLYVDQVDRSHSTLPYYSWQSLISRKIRDEAWNQESFRLKEPIPNVTALALRAKNGDVALRKLVAIDQDKTRWEFNQVIMIPADRPRSEICYLPLPTKLVEIQLDYRMADPEQKVLPRLDLKVGVCEKDESAKQALFHMEVARQRLKQAPPDVKAAIERLRQAHELLREYQLSRRL